MQRMRRALKRNVATAILPLVALTAAMTTAHLRLTASFPAADQVLSAAPDTVRLWFSETPERSLAAIRLEGAQGDIEMGDVEGTDDPNSIKAQVLGELLPGEHRVSWRAAGNDGHAVRGSYLFHVAPASPDRD